MKRKIIVLIVTALLICSCSDNPSGTEREKTGSELVSSYIELAESYYDSGELDKAIETLEEGYSETADKRIKKLLDGYKQEAGHKN